LFLRYWNCAEATPCRKFSSIYNCHDYIGFCYFVNCIKCLTGNPISFYSARVRVEICCWYYSLHCCIICEWFQIVIIFVFVSLWYASSFSFLFFLFYLLYKSWDGIVISWMKHALDILEEVGLLKA
jgi:hypothetical protein